MNASKKASILVEENSSPQTKQLDISLPINKSFKRRFLVRMLVLFVKVMKHSMVFCEFKLHLVWNPCSNFHT